jgi:hypothetical protein
MILFKRPLDGSIPLKQLLKLTGCELGSTASGQSPVESACEYGNEP